jgi:hypothetical protein
MIESSSYRAKPVYCFLWDDKSYKCMYPSVNQMAKELNRAQSAFQYCLKNKTPLSTKDGKYLVSHFRDIV